MKTLQVVLLFAFAVAAAALVPGENASAHEPDPTLGAGEAALAWQETPEEDAEVLPILGPESEARIIVLEPRHSTSHEGSAALIDGESASLAFAAAALAAPMFAAITLMAARGLNR